MGYEGKFSPHERARHRTHDLGRAGFRVPSPAPDREEEGWYRVGQIPAEWLRKRVTIEEVRAEYQAAMQAWQKARAFLCKALKARAE